MTMEADEKMCPRDRRCTCNVVDTCESESCCFKNIWNEKRPCSRCVHIVEPMAAVCTTCSAQHEHWEERHGLD